MLLLRSIVNRLLVSAKTSIREGEFEIWMTYYFASFLKKVLVSSSVKGRMIELEFEIEIVSDDAARGGRTNNRENRRLPS